MLWHRLALHIGSTVEDLQERMSSREFAHWAAFFALEPFGYGVENWRMGVIASTIANVAPRGKNARPLKPSDFCPPQTLTARQRLQLEAKRRRKEKQ